MEIGINRANELHEMQNLKRRNGKAIEYTFYLQYITHCIMEPLTFIEKEVFFEACSIFMFVKLQNQNKRLPMLKNC